jgi:hypothetical protein
MQVTYLNFMDNKRHVLVDQVTQEEAEAIVEKWGNKKDPNFYMPEIKIEEDEA